MTAGAMRPLAVAGVAGGVGTTTFAQLVTLTTGLPVADHGRYCGGLVDVLVTSTTAAAVANVGVALGMCPRPPVLVVMHTVPSVVVASRSYLRRVEPHITERFDIAHQRSWLEMPAPPGRRVPASMKDVHAVVAQLPDALRRMYAAPTSPPPAVPGGVHAAPTHRHTSPAARLPDGIAPRAR